MNAKKCKMLRKEIKFLAKDARSGTVQPNQLIAMTNSIHNGTEINHPLSVRGAYRAYKKEMKTFT